MPRIHRLPLPLVGQPHFLGVHDRGTRMHILRGVASAGHVDDRPRRGKAEIREGGEGARHGRQTARHDGAQHCEIVLLGGIIQRERVCVGEQSLYVGGLALVLGAVRIVLGQQIVAQGDFRTGERAVDRRHGGTHLLAVGGPFDRIGELGVGAIRITSADQQQQQRDDESGQDLDLHGGEFGEPLVQTFAGLLRHQQDSAPQQRETGGGVQRHRRQPAAGDEFTRVPQVPEQRNQAYAQTESRTQPGHAGEAPVRQRHQRHCDRDECGRAERGHPSMKYVVDASRVSDQKLVDA